MLKIKDNVPIEELEKFGFLFIYDQFTGEKIDAFKSSGKTFKIFGLHFFKKQKIIKIPFYKKSNRWIIDDNILWGYSRYETYDFDFDTLYDLIQAGLVEKVGED